MHGVIEKLLKMDYFIIQQTIPQGINELQIFPTPMNKLFNDLRVSMNLPWATRMMNTYQQGLLTLNKLRKGGSQTITIQHVHVADGAQAIIGSVKSGKTGGVGE
jgi:hypothetical protein